VIIDGLLLLLIAGGFLLGFFRGMVRQLLALGAWLVAFVGSAHLRLPLGDWLDASSTQFSTDYSHMLAFAILFLVSFVGGLVLVEFGGAGSALTRHQLLDDALGGVLGLALGVFSVVAVIVVLDSYFLPTPTPLAGEVDWLRDVHRSLSGSAIAGLLHEWVIRPLGILLAPLLPPDIRVVMG
jgi:membrane protein required for colicin V production